MIRLRQIDIGVDIAEENKEILKQCAKKLRIRENQIQGCKIIKKSIDARDKSKIVYCYEIDVEFRNIDDEEKILKKNKSKDIFKTEKEEYQFKITGKEPIKNRPVIVGAGPAGLFSAYMLASYGYRPLVIERGEQIEKRVETVQKFWDTGILNPESNVQFGEGGAGTFSDGKLNTLVKDREHRKQKVLEIFVKMGAPEEILYLSKPHIGTDLLRNVIINLRNEIINLGGEIRYNTRLTDINIENGQVKNVQVNNREIIETDVLILAIGHSARDTFKMLNKRQITMEQKPFAVGVRVQHPQDVINEAQYGKFKEFLRPASYKLTYHASNGRGVYSFCMCPGGYVVNSSSEKGRLAINGMSNHKRDTKNANSAIVVTVTPKDFGDDIFGGMKFQEELERKAYIVGKGKIPVQYMGDFLETSINNEFKEIEPVFKGNYEFTNLKEILPEFITLPLQEAFVDFDRKIHGVANKNAILAAVETRTSSPLRIIRNECGQSNVKGLYPAGEGAGYAGGIMSAAMDGIKIAEYVMEEKTNYKEF